jgi:hypothetical protein
MMTALLKTMDASISRPFFNATNGKEHIFFAIGREAFHHHAPGPKPSGLRSVVKNAIAARDHNMLQCAIMHQDNKDHGDLN